MIVWLYECMIFNAILVMAFFMLHPELVSGSEFISRKYKLVLEERSS